MVLVYGGRGRTCGALPRGVVPRLAAARASRQYDAWAFWVPKGKAIYFFDGLDDAPLHDHAERVVSAAPARSSTPPPSTRWGARTSSRCTCSSGSSSSAPSRAAAGLLHGRTPPRGSSGLLFCSSWSCLASASVCWPLRPTSSSTSSSRRGTSARPVAPRRGGLAARRGRGAARGWRRTRSARASCSRRACSPRRSSSRGRAAGRGSLAASLGVGLAVLPWRLWTSRHDIVVGRAVAVRPTGVSAAHSASRSTFSTRTHAGRCCLSSARSRSCAAAVWGDRRLAAYVGVLVAVGLFAGGVWSTVGFPELAITADESGNPIVRYTGSIVFLAAVAVPLLLARRSGERREEP